MVYEFRFVARDWNATKRFPAKEVVDPARIAEAKRNLVGQTANRLPYQMDPVTGGFLVDPVPIDYDEELRPTLVKIPMG